MPRPYLGATRHYPFTHIIKSFQDDGDPPPPVPWLVYNMITTGSNIIKTYNTIADFRNYTILCSTVIVSSPRVPSLFTVV